MAKIQLLTGSLAALVLATATTTTYAQTFQGDGTSYTLDQVGHGNCAFMAAPAAASQNYAAINQAQWDNLANCGKCAQVSCVDAACPNKSASEIVYIVDRCPECKHGDLDMSPSVFKKITGSSPSRLKVAWKFVDCPGASKLQFCLKDGSNPYWTAIQPANAGTGIASMKINGKAATMLDSAFYYVVSSQSPLDYSAVKVAVTSTSGATVEETVSLSVGSCTSAKSQFGGGSPAATTAPKPTTSAPVTTPKPSSPAATSTPKPVATSKAPDATKTPDATKAPDATTTPVPTTKTPKPTKTPKHTKTPKPDIGSDATTAPTPAQSSSSAPVTKTPVTKAPETPAPKTPAPTSSDDNNDDDDDANNNNNDNDDNEVVPPPSPSPTMKPIATPTAKPATPTTTPSATTKKPRKCKSKLGRRQ